MFIQNHTEYPYCYSMTPHRVSPRNAMSFSIQRSIYTQYNAWPYTYSECSVDEKGELMQPLVDSSLYDRLLESNFTYFRYACIELCYQKNIVERCNCSSYLFRMKVGDFDNCFGSVFSKCERKFRDETFYNFDWFAPNCLEKCPLECSKPTLERFLSSYEFPPSPLYAEQEFSSNPTLFSLRALQSEFQTSRATNMLRLVFYYDTLSYVKVDEEPKMTIDSLIGVIGGHLHLFLGMSVLSFVEICMISIKFVYYTFRIEPESQRENSNTMIRVTPEKYWENLTNMRQWVFKASFLDFCFIT